MRRSVAASVSLLITACGSSGKPFHYPLDELLRLDEVQVKATHNSYHVQTSAEPEWAYTMAPLDVQLDQQGVRQIELDLHWIRDNAQSPFRFEVYHAVLADEGTTCRLLVDCLNVVRRWSDRYPGHLPIHIQMEPKEGVPPAGEVEPYIAALEHDLLSVFPRARIITPDEIRGAEASLPEALAGGWPVLARLRGRVFFALDDRSTLRDAYTHGGNDLLGRLSFIASDPGDPFGAIAILNDPVRDAAAIQAALAAHYLVRTQADTNGDEARADDLSTLDAALAGGANYIETDFPAPVDWTPYFVSIPGGTPARCNPSTARPECTSLALEDPAFVGSGAPTR